MYNYRKLDDAQKSDVVKYRKVNELPLHSPPHYSNGRKTYILTASCYEHIPAMARETRRSSFESRLLNGLRQYVSADIRGWVILPNHYHILINLDLDIFRHWVGNLHRGVATEWNREDQTIGRKIWYRFQDRAIKNESHYFASLNYIHANPVKHGYVKNSSEWKWSSIHEYLELYGREKLVALWKKFPVKNYGNKWDEF